MGRHGIDVTGTDRTCTDQMIAPFSAIPEERKRPSALVAGIVLAASLWVCPGGLGGPVASAAEATLASRVQADTQWLSAYGTRQVGTAAHARVQDDLLARLQAIPGVRVWTDEYPVVVPVDVESFLEIADGPVAGRHAVFPLWPDVGRLNTTPPQGISGRLIYVGDASFDRLPARGLQGQIAVMEMSAYATYRRVFDFGAAAVIFLESNQPGDPLVSQQSLYKPRYYVPAGPLADALRAGPASTGRLVSKGRWDTVMARNIYVGVKPPEVRGLPPYAVAAPYDAMSRVIGVAPGADAAIDCATVLNLLRDAADQPPRPILFGFVDAYHINQLGMRRMAAMLTVTPGGRTRQAYEQIEQQELDEYLAAARELEQFTDARAGLAALYDRSQCQHLRRLFRDGLGADLLRLRELQGELRLAAARREGENEPIVRRQMLSALAQSATWLLQKHDAELTPAERVELQAALEFATREVRAIESLDGSDAWGGMAEAIERASALRTICSRPLMVRNRVLEATVNAELSLTADELPVATSAWEAMARRVRGQVAEQQERVALFEPMDRLRREIAAYFELDSTTQEPAAASFVLGIDLSDCGVLVGPGHLCSFNRVEPTDRHFARALKLAVKQGDLWPEHSPGRRVVNIKAIEGRMGATGHLGERALITSAASSFQLPGVTWVTDDAPRQRVDSPLDRYDQIDWSRLEPQFAATREMFQWLVSTPDFHPESKTVADVAAPWRIGMGRVVDVSAGETVPRVPRPGLLVTLVGYTGDRDGLRRHEFAWTGHDGSFRLPLLCADVHQYHQSLNLEAYRLDDNAAIVESVTTNESLVNARLATTFKLGTTPGEQLPRAVTFECTELNGPSFFDARFLEPLTQASLLDAVRGGPPKQSHFRIDKSGQMWGLVEPDIRWQLVVRAGVAGVRMALLNAVEDGRERGLSLRDAFQRGYGVHEPLPSIASHLSAQDIFTLNEWRLADFRLAGIRSAKIDAIHDATGAALREAAAAVQRDDGAALQRSAVRALASEIRAYRAIQDTGQDVARGAIFLMLMLVPFSVAIERLVFACARIGRQIAAAIAIFAVMTVLLWSFHPAFRISAQPLVIVMSFTILAMSVAVIAMVLARFRASVREFQSALAEGSGAQMGRGGLLGSAVFLGIANMRKRKVRTALTGTTIMLVTFALLCFSSASSYIDKRDFRLDGITARHPSVLVRRPTFGPIDWSAAEGVANLLAEHDVATGQRAWLVPELGDINWRLWLINPATGAQVGVRSALGLPPVEDRTSGIDAVLPDWSRFAAQGGAYLSKETARELGVAVGDRLVVRGHDVVLRGTFDPLAMEDQVTLLDGQRLLPYDYSQREKDWTDRDSQDAIEQEMESATAMQPAGGNADLYVPARDVIVLPADLVRQLGGSLRSISVACASPADAAAVARTLMETLVFPAYYANASGGVNVIVATPLMAVPPKSLAVPLAIAALIIFTTMLNSVSERKKEIYVYSSLGLAPRHIGALFVAEALTYGLMGAVFGYIAGQGMATLLTELGWMQGITLNYSGTSVIKTMLLVQGVVVLAALVPAIVAGRIAAPSSEMDWKVPQPVNGEIHDTLPFTVSPAAAPGLMAFLHEYLEAHRDGVLGGFDVDDVRLMAAGERGGVAGLEARVWLAPFDMGVRQQLWLTVRPPEDGVCEIAVCLRHETGTPKVWWRLNKPFFYDLRRQMLGWRKVTPQRMQQYAERTQQSVVAEERALVPS